MFLLVTPESPPGVCARAKRSACRSCAAALASHLRCRFATHCNTSGRTVAAHDDRIVDQRAMLFDRSLHSVGADRFFCRFGNSLRN